MDVDVSAVHRREPNMNPVEVMTSESQERMLAIVGPAQLDAVLEVANRWEIAASVVGTVTDTGRFRVFDGDELVADVPVGSLGEGPVYERPLAPPPDLAARQGDDPRGVLNAKFPDGADLAGELLALLATPTIADKSWVSRQYDHQLFLNTVAGPGADAAVLRVKGTTKALAISTDGKARFCALDPRSGGMLVVLEAVRNVVCSGAVPKALVNCMNFGNPEHPEIMWQFSEVVDGMSEACRALDVPVVGGNVSFYNESHGTNIDPTPVVGVVGLIDGLTTPPPAGEFRDGDAIVVLGLTAAELAGGEWAAVVHGLRGGRPPVADLETAVALHQLVIDLVRSGTPHGVHDVSDGGLACAIAEMAILGAVGATIDLAAIPTRGACTAAEKMFSESTNRVVVSLDPMDVDAVLTAAASAGVAAAMIGTAGGAALHFGTTTVEVARAADVWQDAIRELIGH
jgi:phosphoribosylformylglycinamidine synthase